MGFHAGCISLRKFPHWLRPPEEVEILSQSPNCAIHISRHILLVGIFRLDIFSGRVISRVGDQEKAKILVPTCMV